MKVHFVCSGNSFRSRIAEAYLNSLKIKGLKATSSGAHSYLDKFDHISRHAEVVLAHEGLAKFASPDKVQLSQELVDEANVVVCMNRAVYYEGLKEGVKFPVRTYIWNIYDAFDFTEKELKQLDDNKVPKRVQAIFDSITTHVDELVAFIRRPRPNMKVDVLDEDGKKTGETCDVTAIHERGLWHQGVHIGLYTKSGKVLLERRSSSIMFNPGLWDLSMGGIVDSGEEPSDAIVREVDEELGIQLTPEDVKKLFVTKYNHYLPHYGFHNKDIIHTYLACIPEDVPIKLQESEVAEAKFLPIEEARAMNDKKRGKYGMIDVHAYHEKILDAIVSALTATA